MIDRWADEYIVIGKIRGEDDGERERRDRQTDIQKNRLAGRQVGRQADGSNMLSDKRNDW